MLKRCNNTTVDLHYSGGVPTELWWLRDLGLHSLSPPEIGRCPSALQSISSVTRTAALLTFGSHHSSAATETKTNSNRKAT